MFFLELQPGSVMHRIAGVREAIREPEYEDRVE
jgi:hypothetical protein